MEYQGCYDSVMEIVDKATEEFSPRYTVNQKRRSMLDDICDAVDTLVSEVDCEFVDVSVDDISKQLTIAVVCDEVIFEHGRSNGFFDLIQMLDSFSFSKKGRESIQIALNINDMWERSCG